MGSAVMAKRDTLSEEPRNCAERAWMPYRGYVSCSARNHTLYIMKVVTSWRTDSWTRGTIQGKMVQRQ